MAFISYASLFCTSQALHLWSVQQVCPKAAPFYSKRSFPVVVPCIDINPKSSSITHRVESTPRMKIDSWAVSDVSLLSSTAREYAMKYFPFPISCCCRSVARSHTQSATVFLLRLTFKNACLLSGHKMSQTFKGSGCFSDLRYYNKACLYSRLTL